MMERLTDEQLTAELDGRIALRDSYIKHGYHGTAAAYDATIMALTELKEWRMAAPQLPQPAVVSFDEWSRKCDLQLELCDSELREKARYIWGEACRAAKLRKGLPE